MKTCRELDNRSERKAGDVFHRAMLTVMLVRCMKKYGYFGPDANDEIMTDDECYIGFVLNHFLEVNQFNAHEVAQVCILGGVKSACKTPALRKASSFLQIRRGNFQHGLFRP